MKDKSYSLKQAHWRRYRELAARPLPQVTPEPGPEEAYRLGLMQGYREGLLVGAMLGAELLASGASFAAASHPFDVS